MDLDVSGDGVFQFPGASMHATANLFFGQHREPAVDQIDPGGPSGGEMQMEAGAADQPAMDARRFVCPVVVEDEMEVEASRRRPVDGVEELLELPRAMPSMALTEDGPALHVERGKQGGGATGTRQCL